MEKLINLFYIIVLTLLTFSIVAGPFVYILLMYYIFIHWGWVACVVATLFILWLLA